MTRAHTLTEKLALSILARDGIGAIWQLNEAAAEATRNRSPARCRLPCGDRRCRRGRLAPGRRRAGVRGLVGRLAHCSTPAIVKFDSHRLKIACVMFQTNWRWQGLDALASRSLNRSAMARSSAALDRPSLSSVEWVHHQPAYKAAAYSFRARVESEPHRLVFRGLVSASCRYWAASSSSRAWARGCFSILASIELIASASSVTIRFVDATSVYPKSIASRRI